MSWVAAPFHLHLVVRYYDAWRKIDEETVIDDRTNFADFLGIMCDVSGKVAGNLEMLPQNRRLDGAGFTLNDGPWYFKTVCRFIAQQGPYAGSYTINRSDWYIFNNQDTFERIKQMMMLVQNPHDGWIELVHYQQMQADANRLRAMKMGLLPPPSIIAPLPPVHSDHYPNPELFEIGAGSVNRAYLHSSSSKSCIVEGPATVANGINQPPAPSKNLPAPPKMCAKEAFMYPISRISGQISVASSQHKPVGKF